MLRSAWNEVADRPGVGYHFPQALAAAGREEEVLSVLRRVLNDADATLAEHDRAQLLLQRLGG